LPSARARSVILRWARRLSQGYLDPGCLRNRL
jgi:hypothetical protein